MKLLDVMKKYDRCVMRESAKLTKIYNLLLKESADADDIEEAEVCPDCGNDPCTCESDADVDAETDEAEESMTAEEFFGEAEKAAEDCDETEDVEENDMLRNRPHNAHIDNPAGIKESDDPEDATDEAEEMMSAEEFFSECGESEGDVETDEAEEMMSAEEFFSESDDPEEKTDESDDPEDATDEAEAESDEKKLEESLKSYRRANH